MPSNADIAEAQRRQKAYVSRLMADVSIAEGDKVLLIFRDRPHPAEGTGTGAAARARPITNSEIILPVSARQQHVPWQLA